MPVFRSRPPARNDSVDVIIGRGIVLELPNGFASLASNDKNIFNRTISLYIYSFFFSFVLCYETNFFFRSIVAFHASKS